MIWADLRAARSGDIGAFGKDTAAAAAVVIVAVLGAGAAAVDSSALSSLAPLQLFLCLARLLRHV